MLKFNEEILLKIFEKMSLCRHFENYVYKKVQDKTIKFPVYLSAGQESIASTIAVFCQSNSIDPNIFIQHRGHSTYIAFDAPLENLIDELLGKETGCSFGMGGSASIQSLEKNIFGHDGLMGSQVPIAVGHCYQTKEPTIVFMGDAAAEEDYVSSAIAWASTKNLPLVFVVEDNNLSILTEKKQRRNWHMHDLAKAYNMNAFDISDNPEEIYEHLSSAFKSPLLLNINTVRKYWHSGAGIDGENFDRYYDLFEKVENSFEIDSKCEMLIGELWTKQLEK